MIAPERNNANVHSLEEPPVPQELVHRQLLNAIAHIRYGSVEVVIHDSRVVQIETREKIRFGGAKTRA
ncbi:MAG TPA: YezD family protein [Burkholderiales bacterium]|jgi:hypothetical protein|nr:YezD family protein [Burkholderiales bacterium]